MNVALIGNQNSGKTSLFNALTAKNEKIGNWAGVTVKGTKAKIKKTDLILIDLPGVYSLVPYSPEEKVTADFVVNNEDAVYLNVVDSTELERSLYLTTQLIERNVDLIVVLNMRDLRKKRGIDIDLEKLSKRLNRRVFDVSVKENYGVYELIEALLEKSKQKNATRRKNERSHSEEKDKAEERYEKAEKIARDCVKKTEKKNSNDILDKIFLNKWAAIPIFIIVMTAVFTLSVGTVGSAASEYIERLFDFLKNSLSALFDRWGVAAWLRGLVVGGMLTGAGAVLSFLPQLIVLYSLLSFLDSSGYMARVAFIFDELMRKIGLDGKTLVPLIIGFGCSVPAAESTKTIRSPYRKKLALFLIPFVPCSAKLPIIALFADFFFKGRSGAVVALIYFLSIISIIASAKIIGFFMRADEKNDFITELPLYRLPSFGSVFKDVVYKTASFIKRAGSVIVLSSIVIWFLSSFNGAFKLVERINDSLLYNMGNGLSFLLYPLLKTNSPSAFFATLTGIIAKEQVVSTMSVISGGSANAVFSSAEFSFFTPSTALAFVIFNVFCPPCVSAISTIKKEFGSLKTTVFAFLYQIAFAYFLALSISLAANFFI